MSISSSSASPIIFKVAIAWKVLSLSRFSGALNPDGAVNVKSAMKRSRSIPSLDRLYGMLGSATLELQVYSAVGVKYRVTQFRMDRFEGVFHDRPVITDGPIRIALSMPFVYPHESPQVIDVRVEAHPGD